MILEKDAIIGGTYRLIKQLGQGGWGAVWLAEHILLAEQRAIKVILGHWATDTNVRTRFIEGEARNTLRLERHRNLVRSYDLGLHENMPYIVMEYVEGDSLQSLLKKRGKLSLLETLAYLEQIAAGLEVAHQQGFIHRDIKPANIFITAQNLVKVGDFGLTKDIDHGVEITGVGYTVGTVAYIAPEQASGEPQIQSDIYSLGIMVYEMLAGRTPFQGSPPQILMQHVSQPPTPLKFFADGVPEQVEQALFKALAKNPQDRYRTVREFAQAFRQAAVGESEQDTVGAITVPLHTPQVAVRMTGELDDHTRAIKLVARPTGMVTFFFTDIEGSTRLWEVYGDEMRRALAKHDFLLRQVIEKHNGYVFKTIGDAFCSVFSSATEAVLTAVEAQKTLLATDWGAIEPIKVRMGLHTGLAEVSEDDYFGPTVNRVARIAAAGHGGQILLSLSTQSLVADFLPTEIELRDMGLRRLKDIARPEHIFQLVGPGLPSDFDPLKTLDFRPTNLPAPPTALVGREKEVAAVCNLLRQSSVRLVTLLGPGGTGKTRLSLQIARELVDEFEEGIFFVELAPATNAAQVTASLAQTLGVKDTGSGLLLENLKNYLREKQILLVLDNFEQVVEAAPVLTQILATASRLKLLVTSRTVLSIYGEYEYSVPPLALPTHRRIKSLSEVENAPAVALFVQRAQAVRGDFSLTLENAPALVEICRRLDGLPLAIELAAARCRNLSVEDIRQQLGQRLHLLVSSFRDLPPRQRTLRGAISWGYELLEETEKQLFSRLAIFAGGFTGEAVSGLGLVEPKLKTADAVCLAEADFDTLDLLQALADQSLLQIHEVPNGSRFVMLETLREFALERLGEQGESDQLQQCHAGYFLLLAEMGALELDGSNQLEWLEKLEAEQPNMRAVLNWSLAEPVEVSRLEVGMRLGAALGWFWTVRGYVSEGRDWLLGLLAQVEKLPEGQAKISPQTLASTLRETGALLRFIGQAREAVKYLELSVKLVRTTSQESGDLAALPPALGFLGIVLSDLAEYERAKELHQEALDIRQQLGDQTGMGNSLNNLGIVALRQKQYDPAQKFFEQSLQVKRAINDRWGMAAALDNLGTLYRVQGEREQAIECYCESISLFQQLGEKQFVLECIEGMASMADPLVTATLLGAVQGLRQELQLPLPVGNQEDYQTILTSTRMKLNRDEFKKAWERGEHYTLEQALEAALQIR